MRDTPGKRSADQSLVTGHLMAIASMLLNAQENCGMAHCGLQKVRTLFFNTFPLRFPRLIAC